MRKNSNSDYRRVKIESDYSGFDFFLLKKPMQCTIQIPETVLLDKNGAPRDWIFNSNKLPHHPILKKRKENLTPFTIIKNFCSKFVPYNQLYGLKTIFQLKEIVRGIIQSKKDAQFMSKKKHIQIRTQQGDVLQINILEFLQYIGENKFAQQSFYQRWRMIQQRVSTSKHDQSYLVESVRRNHIIESKSSKYITVATGNKIAVQPDNNDAFQEVSPSKQLEIAETKVVQGYKFFDTYLNKKFFGAVNQMIDCIQKNFKCIVQSMTSRFVIDHNRQPHLSAIQEIYVKPSLKLFEMREFNQFASSGQMKLDNYIRCLQQFVIENPSRPEFNLEQPIHNNQRNKCRGQFCQVMIESIPHLAQARLKLPTIGGYNTRKLNIGLIESVKKRRGRVIEKLKENGVIDPNYAYNNEDSSEYEQSDDDSDPNVKVCENCFVFYINVLKYFELDAFNNLSQKKVLLPRAKTLDLSKKSVNKSFQNDKNHESQLQNQKDQYKSLKTLQQRMKIIQDEKQTKPPQIKRSSSQHTRLRPIAQKKSNELTPTSDKQSKQKSENKKIIQKDKSKSQIKSNKLIEAKLKNIATIGSNNKNPSLQRLSIKKSTKPNNFDQAVQQLMEKLQKLPNSNEQQFIYFSKKYFKDNLPQLIDRTCYSNQYLSHLYQFMNNSPIGISPGNRIKKRPQMTLKRLSQLTNYPEIVSRSTFIFDTIICDEKTTIPYCVISSKMIHNNNQIGKPYQNIIIVNDIFDSYIEFISMTKQILEETSNTRFILFNYHGQSHTIYEKQSEFTPNDFAAILDKLIYRLSYFPNQLNIINSGDSVKFIGMGYGGFLVQSYMSLCPHIFSLISGVLLINSTNYCTKKYRDIFNSLHQLYSVEDPVTEENSFLFYNKAINSIEIEKEDLSNKSGLNSIRIDGRAFILKNALKYWDNDIVDNFNAYDGKVMLLYSRGNILLSKGDVQKILWRPDEQKELKSRSLKQIDGGHDIAAQNYDGLIKYIYQFISDN